MSSTLAPKLALAATIYHAGAFATLHLIYPEISPVSGVLRDYPGWLATSTFLAFAVIWGSLVIALSPGPGYRLVTVGRVLLGFSACALLLNGLRLATGDHRAASVFLALQNTSRMALFAGLVVVSVGLWRATNWQNLAAPLLGIAAVAFVLVIVSRALLLGWGAAGLSQRAVMVLIYAWSTLVSLRLIRMAKPREAH